jgi:hypothetical protein
MSYQLRQLFFAAGLLGGLTGTGAVETASDWWRRLEVRDLAGATLPATGRWIVLVFLSPECPVANASVPVLNALAVEFAPAGVGFVGIYADPTLEPPVLRKHAAEYQIAFATADDRAQRLVRATGAAYTPETFVFSMGGTLLYRGRIDDRVNDFGPARPAATHEDLREVLTALAAGRPAPFASRPGFGCTISEPVKK